MGLMKSGKLNHKGLVQLHEAYMVRKYLILILDLVEGKTLLDQFKGRHSATEDDVAFIIGELCETLNFLHQQNIVHLDLRPTNIRFEGRDIKLLDYNSSRHLANKKAGAVVDVIGDTEFCAPEMLNFDPVLPASDMWSVAIITYLLLSGVSPFFYEDEAEVLKSVQGVKYAFCDAFDEISSEAKDFIKKCLIRAPEMRMTAEDALKHPWLSSEHLKRMNMSHQRRNQRKTNRYRTMVRIGGSRASRRDWAGLLSVKDIDVYDVEWHAMRCLSSCVIVS